MIDLAGCLRLFENTIHRPNEWIMLMCQIGNIRSSQSVFPVFMSLIYKLDVLVLIRGKDSVFVICIKMYILHHSAPSHHGTLTISQMSSNDNILELSFGT